MEGDNEDATGSTSCYHTDATQTHIGWYMERVPSSSSASSASSTSSSSSSSASSSSSSAGNEMVLHKIACPSYHFQVSHLPKDPTKPPKHFPVIDIPYDEQNPQCC
eukprot:GHVT01022923.1.p3 GENE.GHVT01022923.1~~GHVT01022923.1.p3  ORF type:complete len:106 (-),score=39.78 GHVT01022923.1:477-794(-)